MMALFHYASQRTFFIEYAQQLGPETNSSKQNTFVITVINYICVFSAMKNV